MTRRGLRPLLPALAHFCHVMPWDIEPEPPMLTIPEIAMFKMYVEEILDPDGSDSF